MDVSKICSDLVRIRSDNPPGGTADAIGYIRDLLTERGVRSITTKCQGDRWNLVTERAETGLLLCGHIDVVPALDDGWRHPPYAGILEGDSVWGRGATDMKGGCSALLTAYFRFMEHHDQVPAQLAFVCDEETGGDCGIKHLISKRLIHPGDCLIAEPTPSHHPNIGQKGLVRLELRFTGSAAHGSLYPVVGRSSIVEAFKLIDYLQTLHYQKFKHSRELDGIIDRSSRVLAEEFDLPQASEILTSIMFNPGIITGGEKSNIVAQRCDLDLEIRIPWGCSIPELLQNIRHHAPHGSIITKTTHEPSLTLPSSKITTVTCEAVKKIHGDNVSPIVQWAASDARHLRSVGFDVVEYGPGELRYLHAVDEHVRKESLEQATLVYGEILNAYLQPDPSQTHS